MKVNNWIDSIDIEARNNHRTGEEEEEIALFTTYHNEKHLYTALHCTVVHLQCNTLCFFAINPNSRPSQTVNCEL